MEDDAGAHIYCDFISFESEISKPVKGSVIDIPIFAKKLSEL